MNESKAYNALNIWKRGDIASLYKLQAKYHSWVAAWSDLGRSSGINLEGEWQKLEAEGVYLMLADADNFPQALKEISQPPLAIYYKGQLAGNNRPLVSIVGTRKATTQGRDEAKKFAESLARSGFTIVSGLALGIDTAAHDGALESNGKTIAVLANSLDTVYPRQNTKIAEQILSSGGALISEYPLRSETFKHRFLERNRLVSGLSLGTIVIEAPENSGSLVTANLALEQNREVFVVPGPLNHANYSGSHKLIRAGARLVAKPEDVLEDLGFSIEKISEAADENFLNNLNLSMNQKQILSAVKSQQGPVTVDKIQEISKIDISAVNQNLTFLLIQGIVKEDCGRYYV